MTEIKGYTKNRFDFLVFLIFLFNGTGTNDFSVSDASLVIMSFIGAVYIYFVKKENIDRIFFYVLAYWLLVNFFSWAFLGGQKFSVVKLGGSVFKLFIGYAFMKIFKEKFIQWYEQVFFFLAIVSLLFFAIQLYNPDIFSRIPINFAERFRKEAGHWNGIIFHYSSYHPRQNSGIAGEPGGFGYYLGLAMICNLILHEGRFNKRFLIFTLVGLTTFSTTFYLTVLLFAIFFIYRASLFVKLISITAFIPVALLVYQLPFIGEKVDQYFSETKTFAEAKMVKVTRINRTSMFVNDVRDIEKYPLGRGINETGLLTNAYDQIIEGTNDFSRIALRYGVFGLIYFLLIYLKMFNKMSLGLKGNFLFTIIMCMYIAANSMERDYYAMSLFWLYFIVSEEAVARMLGYEEESYTEHKLALT